MTLEEKFAASVAQHRALIANLVEVGEINERRRVAARRTPPAPLAKARPAPRPGMSPMEFAAAFSGLGELIDYLDKSASEPMTKAHPKPAGRRTAPPVGKYPKAPRDWLDRIEADQRAVETELFRARLRAASAEIARGEATAHDAAKLDILNHRAASLGIWR